MTDLSKTPQEELKEKTWQAASRLAIALTLFGSGYTAGYIQYGDAVELRAAVKQKQDRIVDLENDRETMSTRMAKVTRDKEVCDKELKSLQASAGAAGAGAGAANAAPTAAPAVQ